MKNINFENISDIELDLILLYYSFSDQFGLVDVDAAGVYASEVLGVMIELLPVTITQQHVNALMDAELVADTRLLLSKISLLSKASKL